MLQLIFCLMVEAESSEQWILSTLTSERLLTLSPHNILIEKLMKYGLDEQTVRHTG